MRRTQHYRSSQSVSQSRWSASRIISGNNNAWFTSYLLLMRHMYSISFQRSFSLIFWFSVASIRFIYLFNIISFSLLFFSPLIYFSFVSHSYFSCNCPSAIIAHHARVLHLFFLQNVLRVLKTDTTTTTKL